MKASYWEDVVKEVGTRPIVFEPSALARKIKFTSVPCVMSRESTAAEFDQELPPHDLVTAPSEVLRQVLLAPPLSKGKLKYCTPSNDHPACVVYIDKATRSGHLESGTSYVLV